MKGLWIKMSGIFGPFFMGTPPVLTWSLVCNWCLSLGPLCWGIQRALASLPRPLLWAYVVGTYPLVQGTPVSKAHPRSDHTFFLIGPYLGQGGTPPCLTTGLVYRPTPGRTAFFGPTPGRTATLVVVRQGGGYQVIFSPWVVFLKCSRFWRKADNKVRRIKFRFK